MPLPSRSLALALAWLLLAAARPARAQETSGDIECSEPADATDETRTARAREHYGRGEELYAQGDYELSIPEYLAAYCLAPKPDAVYNIGQAYERLVDYEKAVVWLDRYVRLLPPEAQEERDRVANRIKILRRLPARIRVATDPPGASIVLEGATARYRGTANGEPLRVPAGTYTMRIRLAGHQPVVEKMTAAIGQPYTYSYHLESLTGRVRVTAEPDDARIFVDARLVGTGAYADRLPVGRHEITVEAEGLRPEKREVVVDAARATSVHVKLPARPRSGRTELLVASTIFGLAAGTSAATAFGFEPGSGATGITALAGGAIGFAGPYLGAPGRIPVGMTSSIIGGAAWGGLEGFGVAVALTDDDRLIGPAALGGSVVATVGAIVAARRLELTAGQAATVNSGALWGTVMGVLFWGAFGHDDRLLGPMLLAGLNGGLIAGGTMAHRYTVSRGHVALIDLAGLAGAVTGYAIGSAANEGGSADRPFHFTLGGMATGLVAGAFLTRGMDDRDSRALALPVLGYAPAPAGKGTPTVGLAGTW